MRHTRSLLAGASLLALAIAPLPALAAPVGTQAAAEPCANQDAIAVPGAEFQEIACESDLSATTLSTKGQSDVNDWAALHSKRSTNPPAGGGIQVDGYFPDDSKTNSTNNRNHDSQFVIRLPDNWNGQLVVTGAPGVRKQYANDFIISDWVLSQGYAYASTDKGNTGLSFFNNGERSAPGQALQEWHERVSELTIATKQVVEQRYGRAPERTWMTGISNGGYLTRWQLENRPELYDGGVDWEGTLLLAEGPNLFTYLPTAMREYPAALVDPAAKQRMYDVGFEPGSEVLWPDHYAVYWDLTQRVYREAFDPEYDGATKAGTPFCRTGGAPGTPSACDAEYDYASRPQEVKDAVASVSLTGNLGKPMLTLHGDLDALLPIKTDSDVYTKMITDAGKGEMHRYYVIEDGNHVDDRADLFPTQVRPILPCYREAFLRLTSWVTTGAEPPASQTVARPASGDVANTCPELAAAAVTPPPAGAPPADSPPADSTSPSQSPAPTAGAAGSGSGSAGSGTSGQGSTTAARTAAGSLPATGIAPLLPVLAVLAVGAGAALRRRTARSLR
jgi:predicted esterase